jgi:predicted transcriptional regulator
MSTKKNIKPTGSELEILQILWDKGESTVREVHEILEKNKPVGYTSTLKLMQIMLEKGLVARNADSRTHIYRANINREKTQQQLVSRMIDNVFSGSAARLVIHALGNHKATAKEIEEIKKYLDNLKK